MNLSQKEFAKLLGVSWRTIQNYESGGKIPKSKLDLINKVINSTEIILDISQDQIDEIMELIILNESKFYENERFRIYIKNKEIEAINNSYKRMAEEKRIRKNNTT